MNIKKVCPLTTPAEIRAALRKHMIQTSLLKTHAEEGARCRAELFSYIDFMSEDESKAFLNSVREAPFIPGMDLMWTEEVANYLMVGELPSNMKSSRYRCNNRDLKIDPIPYRTDYVKKRVDKQYWDRLPLGGTANYYSPSQVLRLAIVLHDWSELAEYIAEKLFIKATDLEDCLKPTAKVPEPLPIKPRQRKTPQKKIVLQVPESACVSIDVPKPAEPEIPKVAEIPKVVEVPKQRRNPVVTTAPMFARDNKSAPLRREQSEQLMAIIKERYRGFGGTLSVPDLVDITGISHKIIYGYIHKICLQDGLTTSAYHKITPEFLENVKTRLAIYGGNETQKSLAKAMDVSVSTVNRWTKMIRANMAAATT